MENEVYPSDIYLLKQSILKHIQLEKKWRKIVETVVFHGI